jgi:drug/metabolite transporter (DMT)-like permease
VLVLLRVESFRLDDRLVVGDLLTLANGASFSLYLVMSRRAMRRMDPLGATAVILGFGALGVSAVGAPALAHVPVATLPVRFWMLMGYAVVFATVVCYALNAYALSHTDSSMVALFIYLQPPIATALSMSFLGERPDLRFWIAAAGVFVGVGLAIRAHATERASRPDDTAGGTYTRLESLAPGEP